jgi:nicotinate-nucleotide adenylyltransferase
LLRIGIFGGAFDPPHRAHLALAEAALTQFKLDRLYVIPTGHAWHKARVLTESHHRLAMARLAFAELPQVWVDPREIEREGPTYTVDTLTSLKHELPGTALFLFMGADQAQAFKTWHRWQDILNLATVVVADRPNGLAHDSAHGHAQWHNAVSPTVQHVDMPSLTISATEIRAHLAQALPTAQWLPTSVQHYIDQHRLYSPDR